MASAVQCDYPNCGNFTKDPSGNCHWHRNAHFSGNSYVSGYLIGNSSPFISISPSTNDQYLDWLETRILTDLEQNQVPGDRALESAIRSSEMEPTYMSEEGRCIAQDKHGEYFVIKHDLLSIYDFDYDDADEETGVAYPMAVTAVISSVHSNVSYDSLDEAVHNSGSREIIERHDPSQRDRRIAEENDRANRVDALEQKLGNELTVRHQRRSPDRELTNSFIVSARNERTGRMNQIAEVGIDNESNWAVYNLRQRKPHNKEPDRYSPDTRPEDVARYVQDNI